MIKVLIVEDEIPLLRGIKIMIEKLNPEFSVVKCAYNGKEAIEYLNEHAVDVLFTDINMPLVDGIDVMGFMAKKYPDSVKVVISGYDDFKYAQQAIHFGAKAYLLKPIVQEELKGILDQILEEYKAKKLKKQKDLLKDIVYTRKKTEEKEKLQMLYLCAGPLMKEGWEEAVYECGFWKEVQLEKLVSELLPERTGIYIFEKNQANERIMLLVPEKELDLKTFSENLIKTLEKDGIIVTAAYHQPMIEMSQIRSISYQLRKMLRENILLGESSVLDNEEETAEKDQSIEKKLYALSSSMAGGKKNIILKEVENFFKTEKLRQKDCILLLKRILETFDSDGVVSRETIEETVWSLLLYSRSTEQLFSNLYQMLDERDVSTKQESTYDLMKRVELYAKEHMAEPITSAFLAGHFGLVAPYLSKLFKEYSGYTLSQYIQKIRLDRAKILLEMNEEILAKDVAEMIGYPNPLYFSKIFKKKIGVYPSEYRKAKTEEKMKIRGSENQKNKKSENIK